MVLVQLNWDTLAHGIDHIRVTRLNQLDRIDLTYELLEDFLHLYEKKTGRPLQKVDESTIRRLEEYIMENIDQHWGVAKILSEKLNPYDLMEDLPENAILSAEKTSDGIQFEIGSEFIPTYNELVSKSESNEPYLLDETEISPSDLIYFFNNLVSGEKINVDTNNWDKEFKGIRYDDLLAVLNNPRESEAAYFTSSSQKFTPRRAWELHPTEVGVVFFANDLRARRPLLLDLFPEYVLEIPTVGSDERHRMIYNEYHKGEPINTTYIDNAEIGNRHLSLLQKLEDGNSENRSVGGIKCFTDKNSGEIKCKAIPRLRPLGTRKLSTGELTLIRLSDTAVHEIKSKYPEIANKLTTAQLRREAEQHIIDLLRARVDLLDIINQTVQFIKRDFNH